MAEPLERADEVLLQREAGVVGADGDSHGKGLYGMPTVTISRRGEERVRAGHPWVYRSDVTDVDAAAAGDIVEVIGSAARPIGRAFFSDRSEIAIRMVAPESQQSATSFWRDRLADAIRYREELAIDATAFRLVHGEADRLPSLIVDRYGDYLVVQALSQAVDRYLTDITGARSSWRSPQASSHETIRESACSRGSISGSTSCYGTVPESDRRPRRGRATIGRSVARAENRPLPRPAGKSRSRGALRPRQAARRVQL